MIETTGSGVSASKQSQIVRELNRQDDALQTLEGALSNLEMRLGPIRFPKPPSEQTKEAKESLAPLAEDIRARTTMIVAFANRIRVVLDEIEL